MEDKIKLIYFWIKKSKYGCFENKGFNFSNDYIINFDYDVKQLFFYSKDNSINVFNSFISDKLSVKASVTAIVGDNGVGKTTLMEEIYDRLQSLCDAEYVNNDDYIMVFESKEKIYVTNYGEGFELIDHRNKKIKTLETIYSTSAFKNEFSYVLMTNEFQINGINFLKNYKKGDSCEEDIKEIFKRFSDVFFGINDLSKKNESFKSYIEKECKSRINDKIREYLYSYMKIYYLVNSFDRGSLNRNYLNCNIQFRMKENDDVFIKSFDIFQIELNNKNSIHVYLLQKLFKDIILYIIEAKQVLCDEFNINIESLNDIVIYTLKKYRFLIYNRLDNEEIYLILNDSIGKTIPLRVFYNCYSDLELFLKEICSFFSKNEIFQYFLDLYKSIFEVSKIIKEKQDYLEISVEDFNSLRKNPSRNNSYDFYLFKFVKDINIGMSSGEEKIITLMSQIFFLKNIHANDSYFKTLNKNMLLIIDEIDAFMHPEWQRTLLYKILNLLNEEYINYNFQIIFTTHSPIVLSDMPKENCIFLKKIDDKLEIMNSDAIEQTFGQNVYALYKNAFFLNNGYMGKFSKKYIEELNKYIESKSEHDLYKNFNNCLNMINVIGEPVLRKTLINKFYDKVIKHIDVSKRIEILKNKKAEIENEIVKLEGVINDKD